MLILKRCNRNNNINCLVKILTKKVRFTKIVINEGS